MRTAIVIGSTGLVGSELVKQLQDSKEYSSILLLNRKPSGYRHTKINEKIIRFDSPDLSGVTGDDVFCAIGTTLRKPGSKQAQYKIDCEYPSTIAALLKNQGSQQFILVSSLGADFSSGNFYLRTKGQLEKNVIAMGFERVLILRPSLLLGKRKEF